MMSVSVRSKRSFSAGARSSLSPRRSGMSSPTHAMCKDTKDLNNQLDTIRKNYERSAEKNGSLRDALKTCRKCLQERDRQLDISNRMINKLCLHREALENTISQDKNSIKKLEATVAKAYNHVPGNVRAQSREIAQLSERVQTAEATARAANAVVDKYEREVFMLRAALDVHARDFQDGSGQTVHASLVLALGQAREENGSLGAQLVEAKMKAADAEGAIETLQKEKAWLLEQKRTAETGILHLQKSGVDLSSKLEILQKEHKKVLDELSFERDRVKSLERKVEELQNALSMASSTAETRFKSAISRMQAQTDSLSAEHATVQNSLRSQVITLQKHVDCTTEELRHAHKHLAEERRGRAQDTQSFRADLEEQRKKVAIAESKTRSISDILEGQEQELQVLHHQMDDLTGVNQQLQTELHEAEATKERLKQEAKLSREYGLIVKENAALKQDMHSLQTGPSRVTDSTGGCIEGKNAEALHLADRKGSQMSSRQPHTSESPHTTATLLQATAAQEIVPLAVTCDMMPWSVTVAQSPQSSSGELEGRIKQDLFSASSPSEHLSNQQSCREATSQQLPALSSPLSILNHAPGLCSSSTHHRSSLSAADLQLTPGTSSSGPECCSKDITSNKAKSHPGTIPGHKDATAAWKLTPGQCRGNDAHSSRQSRGAQPTLQRSDCEDESPCLANSVHHHLESSCFPKPDIPAIEQKDTKQLPGLDQTPALKVDAAQPCEQGETKHKPTPARSDSMTETHAGDNTKRHTDAEPARWEKRLKSAQEKLQLMRLEREQWYAMAKSTDSELGCQDPHTPTCSNGVRKEGRFGTMSAPVHYDDHCAPFEAQLVAHTASSNHRHRRLQHQYDSRISRSNAAANMTYWQHAPHEPDDSVHQAQSRSQWHTIDNSSTSRDYRCSFAASRESKSANRALHMNKPAERGPERRRPDSELSLASARMLPTYTTPKCASKAKENPTGMQNRDSGVTQQSHGTWVADSIRQSVTGALDEAMEALEAELSRNLPEHLSSHACV